MAFTGKATYSAGATLPEMAEDVSDLIGVISPYETPLLDALGDPLREAKSTHHEWLEDELLPNKDAVDDDTITNPSTETSFDIANGGRFRAGDQIQIEGSEEFMLIPVCRKFCLMRIASRKFLLKLISNWQASRWRMLRLGLTRGNWLIVRWNLVSR